MKRLEDLDRGLTVTSRMPSGSGPVTKTAVAFGR
jgi:hypothetical protein